MLVVPCFAASYTADSVANSLVTGWMSSYAPSGFTTSYFWAVVSKLNTLTSTSSGGLLYYVSRIHTALTATTSGTIPYYLNQINTKLSSSSGGSSGGFCSSDSSNLTTITSNTTNMMNDLDSAALRLLDIREDTSNIYNRLITLSTDVALIKLSVDSLSSNLDEMYYMLQDLQTMFASPEDLARKEATKANETAVTDTFLKDSGSNSVSVSDIGSVASLGSGFSDMFDFGVSAGDLFSVFGTSEPWEWFTQENKDDLNGGQSGGFGGSTQSMALSLDSSDDDVEIVDYYTDQMEEFWSLVGAHKE